MGDEIDNEKISNDFDVDDNNDNKPFLQLTIDIGNGIIENFKLYNLDNPKKDIYEFCMKNNIDYNTMEEITKHINEEIDKKKDEEENLENNNINKKDRKKLIDNKKNTNTNQTKIRNRNISKQKSKYSIDELISNKKEKTNLFPYQISDYDSNSNQNTLYEPFQKKKNISKNQKINPIVENKIIKNNNQLTINNSNINLTDIENLLNGEIIKIDDYQYGLLSLNNSQGHVSNNSITKKKTLEESIEAGKNLYNRGIEYQEKGKEKLEKLKTKLKKEEKKVSTFHPKINSNKIDDKKRIPCTDNERIINYKQYNQNKINKLKEKNEQKTNYTFQPKVNKENKNETNKIINETNKPNYRFLKLYDDRKIQKENLNNYKNKIENMYSYRPVLNNNNKIKEPFYERLIKYQTKSNEKMKKIKDEIEKKKYIKPKSILRHSKNDNNNNPFTLMYLYNNIYKQNKEELERRTYSNYFSNPIINKSTDKLLENKKERVFKKIFKLLDGDEDNLIKNSAVNTNKIPKNIKEILEPIFRELKEENETLNENEFITVCEQIFLSLPYDKKNILMNFGYDKKQNKTIIYSQKKKNNKSKGLTLFELSNLPKNNNIFYPNNKL